MRQQALSQEIDFICMFSRLSLVAILHTGNHLLKPALPVSLPVVMFASDTDIFNLLPKSCTNEFGHAIFKTMLLDEACMD